MQYNTVLSRGSFQCSGYSINFKMNSRQIVKKLFSGISTGNLTHVRSLKRTSIRVAAENVTHTGQKFDEDDYRLARFIDKKKHVNTQFAVKLIDEVPPKPAKERIVWCNGGGGPTGHPKVYINLDKPGNHTCGYCGLRFFKEDHH